MALDEVYLGPTIETDVTRVYLGTDIVFQRGAGGLDPDVQALLDRAVIDGYTPASGTVLTALNTFVLTLKSTGIWNLLTAIGLPATNGDSDFATYNIKNPLTSQALKVNSPLFTTSEGFGFDSVSSYLDTNIDASSLTESDSSLMVYIRTLATPFNSGIMGVVNGFSNRFEFNNRIAGQYRLSTFSTSPASQTSGTPSPGLFLGTRSGTVQKLYNNGVLSDTDTITNASVTGNLFIGCWNSSGVPNFHSDPQVSFYACGSNVESVQSDIYSAIQTYMTTIGSAV